MSKKKHKGRAEEEEPKAPDARAEAPPEELAELRQQAEERDEVFEKLQRVTADYLNYQKRMQRQMENHGRYAMQDFLSDLLPVIDNLEHALKAAEGREELEEFCQGIQLVHDELLRVLKKHDVEQIDAAGEPFDPEKHEAVAHVPSADHPPNTVIEVMQTGYQLHSRTIRPSRVVVSKVPDEAGGDEEEQVEPQEG